MAAHAQKLLVDIHTHVYLPRYAAFLRSRTSVPRIFTRNSPESGKPEERLLILDDEPASGRPIGAQVSKPSASPANPPHALLAKLIPSSRLVLG